MANAGLLLLSHTRVNRALTELQRCYRELNENAVLRFTQSSLDAAISHLIKNDCDRITLRLCNGIALFANRNSAAAMSEFGKASNDCTISEELKRHTEDFLMVIRNWLDVKDIRAIAKRYTSELIDRCLHDFTDLSTPARIPSMHD